jgi:hypothetical protein
MSSTSVGDAFEKSIFDLLSAEINAGRFYLTKENCKIFKKKLLF